MDINELLANPDFVVTEEDAIREGAIREVDAYGIAIFRGGPVRTVSDTLFRAFQDAFGLAASAGLTMTEQDWAETLVERAADGQSAPAIDDLDGRIDLVPPWAVLGDLLQVFIKDAADTAGEGEPQDHLYATPPVKALGNRPVWLQRPKPGAWTAFFPEDNGEVTMPGALLACGQRGTQITITGDLVEDPGLRESTVSRTRAWAAVRRPRR